MQNASGKKCMPLRNLIENSTFRLLVAIIGLALLMGAMWFSIRFMSQETAPKWATAFVALFVGTFGAAAFFYFSDNLVGNLPGRIAHALRPYVFIGPALLLLGFFLVYPAISTIGLSFQNRDSSTFIGLQNYINAFTDSDFLLIFRNNILWMITVTFFSVTFGLLIAVMADRIKAESLIKSLIFMPMAISSVGASVIWRFVYYYQPPGRDQIGLLNAIVTSLGGEPVAWITKRAVPIPLFTDLFANIGLDFAFPLNTFLLIVILVWMQTGFAMVIISAAVKGVPSELLEAARIDGANEYQVFFKIILPSIRPTILTVVTTIVILVLKVFDIVFVMTSGQFDTQVIANEMYLQMFKWRDFGMGGALAVILFIAVIPVIVNNIRSWQKER
jgi:alpha-glucoside transport system permease protein